MENRTLTLTADGMQIQGEHYTVSNGFLSKASGTVRLKRSDLLSVEFVKRRSKKGMYTVLLIGSILVSMLSLVRANVTKSLQDTFNVGSIQDAYNTAQEIYETAQSVQENGWFDTFVSPEAKIFLTVLIVIIALVCLVGAGYLFSGKCFVELTSMHGTYRVAVQRRDTEIKNMVAQLRRHS